MRTGALGLDLTGPTWVNGKLHMFPFLSPAVDRIPFKNFANRQSKSQHATTDVFFGPPRLGGWWKFLKFKAQVNVNNVNVNWIQLLSCGIIHAYICLLVDWLNQSSWDPQPGAWRLIRAADRWPLWSCWYLGCSMGNLDEMIRCLIQIWKIHEELWKLPNS